MVVNFSNGSLVINNPVGVAAGGPIPSKSLGVEALPQGTPKTSLGVGGPGPGPQVQSVGPDGNAFVMNASDFGSSNLLHSRIKGY